MKDINMLLDNGLEEIVDDNIENAMEKLTISVNDSNDKKTSKGQSNGLWTNADCAWGFLVLEPPPKEIIVNGNKIYFNDGITIDTVMGLQKKIIEVGKELMKHKIEYGQDIPIQLYINSPGGSVIAGFTLIDFIEHYDIEIHTVVNGLAASMGFMLLLCGKKKFALKNSYILIHEIRSMIGGKRSEMQDYMKHLDEMHNNIREYIKEHTKLDYKKIDDLLSRESWLTAKDALKMGIIDDII